MLLWCEILSDAVQKLQFLAHFLAPLNVSMCIVQICALCWSKTLVFLKI